MSLAEVERLAWNSIKHTPGQSIEDIEHLAQWASEARINATLLALLLADRITAAWDEEINDLRFWRPGYEQGRRA